MSNFMKRQSKKAARESIRKSEQYMKEFNKALFQMNQVYYYLKEKIEREKENKWNLTEENFQEEVQQITSYKFSEAQMAMLKQDILALNNIKDEDNTEPS